jgi:hypothetical protein
MQYAYSYHTDFKSNSRIRSSTVFEWSMGATISSRRMPREAWIMSRRHSYCNLQ